MEDVIDHKRKNEPRHKYTNAGKPLCSAIDSTTKALIQTRVLYLTARFVHFFNLIQKFTIVGDHVGIA